MVYCYKVLNCARIYDRELHNLYSTPNIISEIKTEKDVVHIQVIRNEYKILSQETRQEEPSWKS
jgi:hypothetical protein